MSRNKIMSFNEHVSNTHIHIEANVPDNLIELVTDNYTKLNMMEYRKAFKYVNEQGTQQLRYILSYTAQTLPKELEDTTIIKDIKGNYKYLLDKTGNLDEKLILLIRKMMFYSISNNNQDMSKKLANNLYEKYMEINPDMRDIEANDELVKTDILMGMTSMFNKDDIIDYLTIGGGMSRSYEEKARVTKIERKLKMYIQYIPSIKTIEKIEKQLGISI